MFQFISSSREKRFSFLVKLTLIVALLLPQFSDAQLALGPFTTARLPATALSQSLPRGKGVVTYRFASRVGGVAFRAEAKSEEEGVVLSDFTYDPSRPDGKRLILTFRVNGKTIQVVPDVFDWQWIPMARFVQEENEALFTFFGQLENEEEEASRRERGERIFNYADSIDNTLMGLRIMQADLLVFHPAAPYNFTDGGVLVKGRGEETRDAMRNAVDSGEIQKYYATIGAQSYVISDPPDGITFRIQKDVEPAKIFFLGHPYWHCWKRNMTEGEARFEFLKKYSSDVLEAMGYKTLEEALLDFNFYVLVEILTEKMLNADDFSEAEWQNRIREQAIAQISSQMYEVVESIADQENREPYIVSLRENFKVYREKVIAEEPSMKEEKILAGFVEEYALDVLKVLGYSSHEEAFLDNLPLVVVKMLEENSKDHDFDARAELTTIKTRVVQYMEYGMYHTLLLVEDSSNLEEPNMIALREKYDAYLDQNVVKTLPEKSKTLSDLLARKEGGNPTVYRALQKAMHWSAFFRYAKRTHTQKFRILTESLSDVKLDPEISSPTTMIFSFPAPTVDSRDAQ